MSDATEIVLYEAGVVHEWTSEQVAVKRLWHAMREDPAVVLLNRSVTSYDAWRRLLRITIADAESKVLKARSDLERAEAELVRERVFLEKFEEQLQRIEE